MDFVAVLAISSLFGGMLLFSVGFGALSFKLLEDKVARRFIRETFPYFYLWVLVNSLTAALVCYFVNKNGFILLMIIFLTTIPNYRILMPAINDASDSSNKKKFRNLHGFSVLITLSHIILSAFCLSFLL